MFNLLSLWFGLVFLFVFLGGWQKKVLMYFLLYMPKAKAVNRFEIMTSLGQHYTSYIVSTHDNFAKSEQMIIEVVCRQ